MPLTKISQLSSIGNSGVTALTIDSSGRILQPAKPAFVAYSDNATTSTYSSGGEVIFNKTASTAGGFNIGGHYDTSNGRFTAPIAGVYQFSFSSNLWVNSGTTTYLQPTLCVNGTKVMNFYQAHDVNAYSLFTFTHLLNLSASDYVSIKIEHSGTTVVVDRVNSTTSTNQYSYFSGQLVG
tara:strand:+ start:72 stop:611 length:540 start_codon:yes stop_codon:yes gene_type:complete